MHFICFLSARSFSSSFYVFILFFGDWGF